MEDVEEEQAGEQTDPMIKEISRVLEIGERAESQQPIRSQKPKYRKGRVITTINDAVIVDDKPHPYGHGKYPFVDQVMHKVPNEFWGIGDIEQLIPLQDALNHAYQQVDDVIAQVANQGFTIDPSLGKKNIDTLSAKIGIPGAIKIAPLDKIKVDAPAQIPQYLIIRINDIIQRIYEVTGISEILQGSGRVTHRTARGIERLFEAGTTRIGKSIQYYERALKEVALMMAELVNQFYTEEKIHAIIGGNGMVKGTIVTQPGELKGQYEVTIDSGAALPRDKQSKADLVFNLADKGIFAMAQSPNPAEKMTAKVVLDAVEFPGREELLNAQALPPSSPEQQASPPGAPASSGAMPPGAIPPGVPSGDNPLAAIVEMAAAAGLEPEQFAQLLAQAGAGVGP